MLMRALPYLPVLALGMILGWNLRRESAPPPTLSAPPQADRPTRLPAPLAAASAPAHHGRRVDRDTPLGADDRALLEKDAVTEARRQVDETRAARREQCKSSLPHASDELCERILQANGHAIRRAIEMKQRFLRGEIDQDEFQSQYHKMFLERAVELEQFLPAKDFLALEHMGPGDDMFLAMLSGPQNLKTFHLGDDLLDPQLKAPENEHAKDEATR